MCEGLRRTERARVTTTAIGAVKTTVKDTDGAHNATLTKKIECTIQVPLERLNVFIMENMTELVAGPHVVCKSPASSNPGVKGGFLAPSSWWAL